MTLSMAIFTFLVSWFITPFLVIPFRLSIKKAIIWNTLLAAIVTLIIYTLIKTGLVPLRDVY